MPRHEAMRLGNRSEGAARLNANHWCSRRLRSGTVTGMTSYGISLFGDLGVTYGGEPIPVSGSRQRSLLALLAINPQPHPESRPDHRGAVGR